MTRSENTTFKVSRNALQTLNRWCKAKRMDQVTFMDAWIKSIELKKQQEFYATLPKPSNYINPLLYTKIEKKYTKTNSI